MGLADGCQSAIERMLTTLTSARKTALILFASLSLCYTALAPGTTSARGYVDMDLLAGLRILESFNAWVKGRPVPPLIATKHGPLPLIVGLPFIKFGKLYISTDFIMSLQAVLVTAAMLTVLYLWLRKLCSPGISLILAIIGAFTTMLWPYAYVGLETNQSFFVFLAGYLGLANGTLRSWPRVLLFSLAAACAIGMKSTGIVFAPAILYLIYVQFRDDWRARRAQLVTVIFVIGSIFGLNYLGWRVFWNGIGGGVAQLSGWLIDSPIQFFINIIGLFGSPTKGLFVFAPVLLLVVYAVPRVFRTNPEITIFALLVTSCIAGFLALLTVSGDEVWGPRFLHVTITPLLLLIGIAWPRFRLKAHIPMLLLAAFGFVVSFLGAFFYYGNRMSAAADADQNTIQWFAGDNVWNEVVFNAQVFRLWLKGGTDPVPWTPVHIWAWSPPEGFKGWKTVNLRDYARPQSFLLQMWDVPLEGPARSIFRVCALSLLFGPVLLVFVLIRTMKEQQGKDPDFGLNRSMLQRLTGLVVVIVACWNVWALTLVALSYGSRESNRNVVLEKIWRPIFHEFVEAKYRLGDVGYVTARTLRGEPPTEDDVVRRVGFYYAAIPLNIVPDKLDSPFLLADFTLSGPPDELPEGFEKVYDSGDGLLLLKHRATQ
jgi:hypothetical protein